MATPPLKWLVQQGVLAPEEVAALGRAAELVEAAFYAGWAAGASRKVRAVMPIHVLPSDLDALMATIVLSAKGKSEPYEQGKENKKD